MTKEEAKKEIQRIRANLRVTKITCTRSVKSRSGDSFVGFSASWQSVQNDVDSMGDCEEGIPLQEAKTAQYLLAMETDIAAVESATANGGMSQEVMQATLQMIRSNYSQLMAKHLGVKNEECPGG